MKEVTQLLVRGFDLAEAEGRVLLAVGRREARRVRGAVNNIAVSVTCLLISIPLFVAGFGLLTIGLMGWLETMVIRPLAAGLTGLAVLAFAFAWLLGFNLIRSRNRSMNQSHEIVR